MDKKRKRIILEDSSSFCLYNKEIKNLELEIDDQITEEKWIKIEEILEKRAKERSSKISFKISFEIPLFINFCINCL